MIILHYITIKKDGNMVLSKIWWWCKTLRKGEERWCITSSYTILHLPQYANLFSVNNSQRASSQLCPPWLGWVQHLKPPTSQRLSLFGWYPNVLPAIHQHPFVWRWLMVVNRPPVGAVSTLSSPPRPSDPFSFCRLSGQRCRSAIRTVLDRWTIKKLQKGWETEVPLDLRKNHVRLTSTFCKNFDRKGRWHQNQALQLAVKWSPFHRPFSCPWHLQLLPAPQG